MALRRFLRRNPWVIISLGCFLVIVVILDAGRRTGEFQKHKSKYHGPKETSKVKIVNQNATYVYYYDSKTTIRFNEIAN